MNEQRESDEGEGIELTLGLSLNGKFGVDPLRRSLSISPPDLKPNHGPWASLSRTYSLPDEDSIKRKEAQMLRRLEVKRRRVEKMRIINAPPPLSSQGSSGSGSGSGSWSWSSSEFDGLTNTNTAIATAFSGMSRSTEVKSPHSVQSLDQNEHKSLPTKLQNDLGKMAAAADTNPSKSFSDTGEMVRNVLTDMPCVSTKVNGPNGKRMEGFLYRFKKGEEVRIVCVCHGSFLTPAEFIKHAGGGDVEHPLRHIVVNSSSFFNLR